MRCSVSIFSGTIFQHARANCELINWINHQRFFFLLESAHFASARSFCVLYQSWMCVCVCIYGFTWEMPHWRRNISSCDRVTKPSNVGASSKERRKYPCEKELGQTRDQRLVSELLSIMNNHQHPSQRSSFITKQQQLNMSNLQLSMPFTIIHTKSFQCDCRLLWIFCLTTMCAD